MVPLHALVETHGALAEVARDGRAPAHRVAELRADGLRLGAPRRDPAVGDGRDRGQFEHPLVLRAKLEIAAACHAHGQGAFALRGHRVPQDLEALAQPPTARGRQLGYTRMWSIHPAQVKIHRRGLRTHHRPKSTRRIEIIRRGAERAHWAPIRHRLLGDDRLHDRASYRYFWQVLERAHRTSFSATGRNCRPRCAGPGSA
jgi:citrate lyase subunit beta/citryl-CoA lyase